MINIEKIKIKPIVIHKKENGKFGIINGQNRIKVLKLIGITELKPEMYNYFDGSYNRDIINLNDIEVK